MIVRGLQRLGVLNAFRQLHIRSEFLPAGYCIQYKSVFFFFLLRFCLLRICRQKMSLSCLYDGDDIARVVTLCSLLLMHLLSF